MRATRKMVEQELRGIYTTLKLLRNQGVNVPCAVEYALSHYERNNPRFIRGLSPKRSLGRLAEVRAYINNCC